MSEGSLADGFLRTAGGRALLTISVLLLMIAVLSQGQDDHARASSQGEPHVAEISGTVPLANGAALLVIILVDTRLADPEAALEAVAPGAAFDEPQPGDVTGAFVRWLTWPATALPLDVGYNGSGAPPGIDAAPLLQETTSDWNEVTGHTWRFNYIGLSTATTEVCGDDPPDGALTVGWRDDLPLGILARTCAYVVPVSSGKQATAMDVAFSNKVSWSTAAATPTGSYDLQSTMLHELGHVIGLDHSNQSGAVMLSQIGSGQQRRTLSDDDIDGIRALYPAPIIPPNARFIPVVGRD